MEIKLTKSQAKKRILKLREEIERLRYRYHVLDDPSVDDAVYDSLERELFDLEKQFPEFRSADSPINRVSGKALDQFKKVVHKRPMLSIQDAFSFEEISDWEERNARFLGGDLEVNKKLISRQGYFCELKIDGLAMSLIYRQGLLIQGATRGDGATGEDVIQNIKTIRAIPLKLANFAKNKKDQQIIEKLLKTEVEIRGEVYMRVKDFEKFNKQLIKNGQKTYANPRNLTAGSIRQLDPQLVAGRPLFFFGYILLNDLLILTHQKEHQLISQLGVPIEKHQRVCQNLDEVKKFINEIEKLRSKLEYQIDGVVITVNDNQIRQKLGAVGKSPRSVLAYKYAAEKATTLVEGIVIQVGRTGALTPVAVLRPVNVAGVIVSRATLHNEDEIRKKDVRIGDTVVIQRAGDVIPEVVEVLKNLRPKSTHRFHFPKTIDGIAVVRPEGEAVHRLVDLTHFNVLRRQIQHFVSRRALDIDGLGIKIIEKLLDEGLIKDATDLYDLKEGDLEPLERFAEKSAANIVHSIQNSKVRLLWRILYALGIRHVGEETARDLADFLVSKVETRRGVSLRQILNIARSRSVEEFLAIPDVGEVVAHSIYRYFHQEKSVNFVKRLIESGVEMERLSLSSSPSLSSGPLVGKTVVVTGTLERFSREQAEEAVRTAGGQPTSSVSSKTDFVLVGSDPGSKYDKALKLGVKILEEKEFEKMIK